MVSRNYCFTINNPTALLDFTVHANVKYAVYQAEIGEEGTNHFQGYIELRRPQRLTWIKNNLDGFEGAHLEPRHGSARQASDYAMKVDTRVEGPWIYGEMYGQGERMDVVELKNDINAGKTDLELWDNHPLAYLRFHRAIDKVRTLKKIDRNWEMENTYVYGPPGVGKSYYCNERMPGAYWKVPEKWWDGYMGGDVILDEFNGYITWTELLRLLDRYPMMVQPKGTYVNFTAKKIMLTSNKLPSELYTPNGHPLKALTRRFRTFVYFSSNRVFQEFDNYEEFNAATAHLTVPDFVRGDIDAAYRQ